MAITATKRLQEIVDLLDQKGYVKAKELSKKYQVSMETIRKDLTFLEEKGVVKKEYGGATLSTLGVEKILSFEKNKNMMRKKKFPVVFLLLLLIRGVPVPAVVLQST